MNISDLIKQKLTIESWDITPEIDTLTRKLSILKNDINNITVDEFTGELGDIETDVENTIRDMRSLVDHIDVLKRASYDLMQEMSKVPMAESYELYERSRDWINEENLVRCRELDQFKHNEQALHAFDSLIAKYSSWKFPTVYIRPNSMHFWDTLKSSDFIYVLDQAKFNKYLFQNLPRRFFDSLRMKHINENHDEFITSLIPKNSAGLIIMEHFMHYKPMDIMKQYLAESFEILRPGGHLLFTYNNCDRPTGAKHFEKGIYCYQPGSMVKLLCELAGFEVVNESVYDSVSWFALKKPGELESLKGGKTLGQIIDEPPLAKNNKF